jgi:hypothetical protein
MVEKNPPLAMPLTTLNIVKGARLVETGQTANMLIADKLRARNREFRGPILSHNIPLTIRPTAEEKLNPANSPAPVAGARPIARANRGMKKGGTKRGNVPMAPAKKMNTKLGSLNKRLKFGLERKYPTVSGQDIRSIPFDEASPANRRALLQEPRSGQSSGQGGQT